jgi:uncharacterized protein (DUF2384 family)
MRFQRANANKLPPAKAKRQFDMTRLALALLGREGALQFMNNHSALLDGRPIDLAIASVGGYKRVEAELARLSEIRPA